LDRDSFELAVWKTDGLAVVSANVQALLAQGCYETVLFNAFINSWENNRNFPAAARLAVPLATRRSTWPLAM
jgi:hypothetical protein